ncbi:MAG TPA: phage/plasmid primase, P4 family [Polyangiaceae bacterium]|nr:phage/plasmid primase, P4 family [Polyangiaceae bacterium]
MRAPDDNELAQQGRAPKDLEDGTVPVVGPGFKLTDLGNAERLVARFRDRIRFCPPRRKWFVWDGKRWSTDETGEVLRFAKQTVRGIYGEAEHARDEEHARAVAKHAVKSEDGARIKAMVTLAQSELGVPVMPHELDADPMLLNVENGTIDLRTGVLRKHARADLLTKLAPVVYDADAKLDAWEKFLVDATGGDADLASYLQRLAGYALTGLANEKKFFFVFGPSNTSKSTFIDALTATWGTYAETADFSTWLEQTVSGGNRGDLVRLAGARLVSSVEVKKGRRWDEALIKRVVGGDVITAAAKYEAEVSFRATFKILLAAEVAPAAREDDAGMWARVQRIPFVQPIPKKDPKVKATLSDPAAAGPAILAWAVRGCLEWQRAGLGTATAVEKSTAAYHAEMDRVARFFDECCVFENDDDIRVKRDELRKAYEAWCEENGVRPVSPKEFAERLREDEKAEDGKSNGVRIWKKVRLLGPNEDPKPRPVQEGHQGSPLQRTFLHVRVKTKFMKLVPRRAPSCPQPTSSARQSRAKERPNDTATGALRGQALRRTPRLLRARGRAASREPARGGSSAHERRPRSRRFGYLFGAIAKQIRRFDGGRRGRVFASGRRCREGPRGHVVRRPAEGLRRGGRRRRAPPARESVDHDPESRWCARWRGRPRA